MTIQTYIKSLSRRNLWAAFFLCAAFASALFFTGTDKIWFATSLLAMVGFLIVMISRPYEEYRAYSRNSLVIGVSLYVFYLLGAVPFSQAPFVSIIFTLTLLMLPLIFLVTIIQKDRHDLTQFWVMAMVAAITLCALSALAQYYIIPSTRGLRVEAPMLNPNNLAALLNIGVVCAAGLFFHIGGRRIQLWTFFLYLILYAGSLVTLSRGGFLSLWVALFVLILVGVRPLQQKYFKTSVILILTAFLPFLIRWTGAGNRNANELQSLVSAEGIVSISDRWHLWASTWLMIMDHPFMGGGIGTFYYTYGAYRTPQDMSDGYFAHMDPLQFGAEAGIILPAIFYFILIAVLWRTVRALRQNNVMPGLRLKIVTSFTAMLVVVGHAHIDFHLYMGAILIPLGVLLSYWYLTTAQALEEREGASILSSVWGRRCQIIAMIIVLVGPGLWLTRSMMAILYVRQSVVLINNQEWDQADKNLKRAALWAPQSYFNVPQYQARLYMARLQNQQSGEDARPLYEAGLDSINKAIDENRIFSNLYQDRARLYVLAAEKNLDVDAYDKAIADLKYVLARDPLYIDARIRLADIYKARGETQNALEVLEDGLRWPRVEGQEDINYIITVANLHRQLGHDADYQMLVDAAAQRAEEYGLMQKRP